MPVCKPGKEIRGAVLIPRSYDKINGGEVMIGTNMLFNQLAVDIPRCIDPIPDLAEDGTGSPHNLVSPAISDRDIQEIIVVSGRRFLGVFDDRP